MPAQFRMPAEWEPHEGTWIAWPHEKSDWPGKFQPIPWVYCEIVRQLSRVERVHILVNDEPAERSARKLLKQSHVGTEAVDFFHYRTDRSWCRDFCPTFARDERGKPVVLNWQFNGWAKYDNWQVDDAVPSAIAAALRMREVQPKLGRRRVVLEGGGIEVNGSGRILTTEEWLLSDVQQRNPGFTREDYERVFAQYLGASETIWLNRGIAGDDTHGHIDDLARFVDADTVVIALERDRSEENYEPLQENLQRLKRLPLKVVPLPMPEPIQFGGQRLPASYANFYIANGLVLVPVFNDKNDRVALNTLAKLFPDREIVGIYSGDLVLGLGTLHCLTQQQIA
jgi:agmatine deiminase